MPIKIGIMSYKELTGVIQRMNYRPPDGVEVRIIDALLDEALATARALERNGEIDVFISAGANLALLSPHLSMPLVGIKVTGFDFLLALSKVTDRRPVGVVTYQHRLPYLDSVTMTLSLPLREDTFDTVQDLDDVLDRLRDDDITTIIGGSIVVERARSKGMNGIFIYSEDGVLRALDSAVDIGLSKKAEAEKAEELRTIINAVHEGIIASDRRGAITLFNPRAEKITRIQARKVIGQLAVDSIPGTRLHDVLATGEAELSQIQIIGDAKVLTNRVPIITRGEITGAVATFQDIDVIQRAEEKIRFRLSQRGFLAKNRFADIIHSGRVMAEAIEEARHYARSDSTTLILGESGVGKEIFAQAIHNESDRRKSPFVAINCAALPADLLESELFGYEEGAFTGAKKGGKPGLFELSHNGSIFLDEIGDLPQAIQSRLLRVLQESQVLRLGGERIVPINIRVIAATNKNLWEMVKQGRFRQDLYYRLCVLEVQVPPLRKRREDIPLLAAAFLREFRTDLPDAVVEAVARHKLLREHDWPGNIRELRNIVERFSVLYRAPAVADQLLLQLLTGRAGGDEAETTKILEVVNAARGNKTEAAKKLGISRTTLWRRLNGLGCGDGRNTETDL